MQTRIDYKSHAAMANNRAAIQPYRPADNVDYHVGDVVICKIASHGLQAGGLYPVEALARRRVKNVVETTVTVLVEGKLVEITAPEPILRTTRLRAGRMLKNGLTVFGEFADTAELDDYCSRNRIPREKYCFFKYIEILHD